MPFIFASTLARAARRASFAAASTRSASSSGSLGSTAFGSMRSSFSSPAAVATTVTAPPPDEASATSFAASSCSCCICACISCACFMSAFRSKLMACSFLELPGVECALHQLENVLLAVRHVVGFLRMRDVAELELDGELASRHLVESLPEHCLVLRVLGELQMERRGLRKLERQRVAGERRRVRFCERLSDRDGTLLHRRQDRPPPRLLQLLELDWDRDGGRRLDGGELRGTWFALRTRFLSFSNRGAGLQQLDSVRERLAREIRRWPRHLHQRKLERQARVAALPHVVHRDREQVDQTDDGRGGQLVRLLAQALARLFGHGQRVGDFVHVLHEQQMAQMLEQVGDEAAEVLPVRRQLLEEEQR